MQVVIRRKVPKVGLPLVRRVHAEEQVDGHLFLCICRNTRAITGSTHQSHRGLCLSCRGEHSLTCEEVGIVTLNRLVNISSVGGYRGSHSAITANPKRSDE